MNPNDRLTVISILDQVLGSGNNVDAKTGVERIHYCPFCNHHKPKLQINIETQRFHCWVCDAKGSRLKYLLNRLDINHSDLQKIYGIYKDEWITTTDESLKIPIKLPSEFKPLHIKPNGLNLIYNDALRYLLSKRKLTMFDIMKFNIGYCEDGIYKHRIIIPSYEPNGMLNYFVSRSFYDGGYKNPPVSKNVVIFENQINWKLPIVICEGTLDAISIKRNAIPLLGKFISKKLMNSIIEHGTTEIIIMLDADAQDQALFYTNYFSKQGISVKNIIPSGKDPNEMGFNVSTELTKQAKITTYSDIIQQKLNLI